MTFTNRLAARRVAVLISLAAVGMIAACQPRAGADPATINLNSPRQVIDGFGGSSAWSGALSDSVMDTLFGNGTRRQIGLSLLRVRIDPNEDWKDETANAQKAHARGAQVLGTPWTPPAAMKTNNNPVGGELKADQYAAFARFLHSAGAAIGLDYCSVQNEPDFKIDYESCTWSASQIQTFCRDNAGDIGRPIVMPESYHFDDALAAPTLADDAAARHVAVVGGHIYGVAVAAHPDASRHGKRVWMTEHYINGSDIGTCCRIAQEISDCLENDMNAYFWWFVTQGGCKILDGGTLLKNGATLGQFSKFIRPGFRRVEATAHPSPGLSVTGYTGPRGAVVVVAVNTGATTLRQTFTFTGRKVTRVIPTQTTATADLATLAALPVMNGTCTATLPAQSVTTFVGTATFGGARGRSLRDVGGGD